MCDKSRRKRIETNYHICMKKEFSKIVWLGFLLWLMGYILGIILFPFVSIEKIGWIIMPIGIVVTLWVLFKKLSNLSMKSYYMTSVVWTMIAIIADYLFLVLLFKPADGYYKLDVYIYYIATFLLPVFFGWYKQTLKK